MDSRSTKKMSYRWMANGIEIIAESSSLKEIAWRINLLYDGMVNLYFLHASPGCYLAWFYYGSGLN